MDELNRPAADTILFHKWAQRGTIKTHCYESGLIARIICKGQHSRSLQSLPGTWASKGFAATSCFFSPGCLVPFWYLKNVFRESRGTSMKNWHLFPLSTKDICLFMVLSRSESCFQLYVWIYCLALGKIVMFLSLIFLCLFILFNYKQSGNCLSLHACNV